MASAISFAIEGVHPHDVAEIVARHNLAAQRLVRRDDLAHRDRGEGRREREAATAAPVGGPHQLLLGGLIVGHRLNHRHTASAAGEQHRTVSVCRMLDDTAGVDLQVGQRNHVLGEFGAHAGILSPCKQGR